MQTIGPTYRAYADPRWDKGMFDPLSNILASMRYALARYGSLPAAYNRKGGYHDGGVIPGRDEGYAFVQGGERVLSRPQTDAFERLVDGVLSKPTPLGPFGSLAMQPAAGPTTQVDIHNENHFREEVDLDLFNQRQDFAVRAVSGFGG